MRDNYHPKVICALLILFLMATCAPRWPAAHAQGYAKTYSMSYSTFRESYQWTVEAKDIVEARKKAFESLEKIFGENWKNHKSGKINLYEK